MSAAAEFIATQQLWVVQQELGSELCQALEMLTDKLNYGFIPALRQRGASPREFAELREAKSLLSYLNYPDHTEPLRSDDIAWALTLVKNLYVAEGHGEWLVLFNKAAQMLGLDLSNQHPLPADLGRRIGNELQLMGYEAAPAALAAAAA